MNQVKVVLSDIKYLQKKVGPFEGPFRFTLTLLFTTSDGREIGGDLVGCLGGVRRTTQQPEWVSPMVRYGVKPSYIFTISPDLYELVLKKLVDGRYFKYPLKEVLDAMEALKPVPAEAEGKPGSIDVL